MTTPEKYTSAWGFEPGVRVEVTRTSGTVHVGIFEKLFDGEINIFYTVEYSGHTEGRWIDCEDIKSIRVLSGLWAVWQFASTSAIAAVIDKTGFCVNFYDAGEVKELENIKEYAEFTVLDAPWWWLEVQK